MKTFTMAVWVIFYCIWFVYYMDNFVHPRFDFELFKACTGLIWALGIGITWLDEYLGYNGDLNRYVNYTARFCSMIVFIIFSLHYVHLFNDTYCELYAGLFFILMEVIFLMVRAYKKGYFKPNLA